MAQSDPRDIFKMLAALCQKGRFQEALPGAESLAKSHPNQFAFHQLHGAILKELGDLEAARKAFRHAVALKPDDPVVRFNLGLVCQNSRCFDQAVEQYSKALALQPDYHQAANNLGNAHRSMGAFKDAQKAFERALKIKPDYMDAWFNLAGVLSDMKEYPEALKACDQALALQPDRYDALALSLRLKARLCIFDREAIFQTHCKVLGIEGAAVPPLALLSMEDNAARQSARSKAWAKQNFGSIERRNIPSKAKRPDRLRVGYFSSDFHDHATLRLMSGLLRCHDKTRFEIIAYGFGPSMNGPLFDGLKGNLDVFHDIDRLSDQEAVDIARSHQLDIAIDVNGFTKHARTAIFAHRVAPVQISYLGFPGTLGMDGIDYLVADQMLIPPSHRSHYSESVIFLTGSYQPNDWLRPVSEGQLQRSDVGLPEDGFVYCCFNACHKIGSAEFDIWMRCLVQNEKAVLWLIRPHPVAEENLMQEAERRGVSGHRLVFADPVSNAEHLARHRLADLFLDTFNYNAHTTGSDALWAGLPLVTKIGAQFSARVGASLLRAVGLPELITTSAVEYEALINRLSHDQKTLSQLKSHLESNLEKAPLFNTEAYTRHFETALDAADRIGREEVSTRDIHIRSDEVCAS